MLGDTGIEVTRLCFGSLTIGPVQAALPTEAGSEIIAHAIQRGINFFDTAQLYGTYPYLRRGMEITGRNDIVISSKTYAWDKEEALAAVEEARRELDRDMVDIFMLHEQENAMTLRGHRDALDALYGCKAKGVIRAVGVSTHHVAGVEGAAALGVDVIHPIINMDGLGIDDGDRDTMEAAVRGAREKGTGIFSMKPLGGGNLLRKAEDALSYVLGLDYIDSIAIGMQSIEEVDANIGFWETKRFTDGAKSALAQKKRKLHIEEWCTGCGSCVGRCAQRAIKVSGGRVYCNHEICILCGYCSTACGQWAIKVV